MSGEESVIQCPQCKYILSSPDWRCPECYHEFDDTEATPGPDGKPDNGGEAARDDRALRSQLPLSLRLLDICRFAVPLGVLAITIWDQPRGPTPAARVSDWTTAGLLAGIAAAVTNGLVNAVHRRYRKRLKARDSGKE